MSYSTGKTAVMWAGGLLLAVIVVTFAVSTAQVVRDTKIGEANAIAECVAVGGEPLACAEAVK